MSRLRRATLLAIAVLAAALSMATAAQAVPRSPELKLAIPDSVEAGESMRLRTFIFNNTDQRFKGPLTITWTVSGDAEVITSGEFVESSDGPFRGIESTTCTPPGPSQTCTIALNSHGLGPGVAFRLDREGVSIIAVSPSASGEIGVHAHLSTPGAPAADVEIPLTVGPPLPYGIEEWKVPVFGSAETPQLQAGSTPSRIENKLRFTSFSRQALGVEPQYGLKESLKDAVVHLPPGLIGNPQAVPYCPYVEFADYVGIAGCPRDSQVGIFKGVLAGTVLIEPLFNIEPALGEPARFGFSFAAVPVILDAYLRQGDYGIDVSSKNTNTTLTLKSPEFEFWGVPGEPRYDGMGGLCLNSGGAGGSLGEKCPSSIGRTSFLRLPTHCTGEPLHFPIELNTWEQRDVFHEADYEAGTVEGCENVPFEPDLQTAATAHDVSSPTGLRATLKAPNPGFESPDATSESDIKAVKVSLPEGMTINPSQAEGLGVCSAGQYESSELSFHPDGSKGCPADSKIGTVEVKTPVLEETIPGEVFVAKPYENPFGSLLALYVVLEEPQRGILVKLAGKVDTDPRTGQITTTFDEPAPAALLQLRAATSARAREPPWSPPKPAAPIPPTPSSPPGPNPDRIRSSDSSFKVSSGIGGGPCPSGGLPPFKPGLHRRHPQQRAPAPTPPSTCACSEPTPNRRSPTSRSSCRRESSPSSPASPTAQMRRSPRRRLEPHAEPEELASPSCPAASQIGQHPGRSRSGLGPDLCPRQDLPRRPLPRLGDLDRGDHRRQGRPLRPRHRGRPPGPAGRPRNRRSLHRRHRLRPDPPHHPGHPAPPAATSAPTSTGPNSSSTRPTASAPRPPPRSWARALTSPRARRPPGHRLNPLPGSRLRRPPLQAQARAEPQGRHQARRAPRAFKRRPNDERPRRSQHRPSPGHPAQVRVPRQRPHRHDLHQGAVQAGHGPGRKLPAGVDLRQRQGDHPDSSTSRCRARSSCAPPNTSCPTWSPPCTTRQIDVVWSAGRLGQRRPDPQHLRSGPRRPGHHFILTMQGGKKGLLETRPTSASDQPGDRRLQRPKRQAADFKPLLKPQCGKGKEARRRTRSAGRLALAPIAQLAQEPRRSRPARPAPRPRRAPPPPR